jgi:beta-glucosidase
MRSSPDLPTQPDSLVQAESPKRQISRRKALALGLSAVTAAALGIYLIDDGRFDDDPTSFDPSLEYDKRLELAGTAGSIFQDDPEAATNSDWAHERQRSAAGLSDKIAGPFDSEEQPHFFKNHPHILKAAKRFGNAYRTSFDFAELCPEKGKFNQELMAQYVRILARCHHTGLEPVMTMHHWPMPKSFATYKNEEIQNGPLEHPDIVDHFAFYVKSVADFLFDPNKIREALKDEGYSQEFLQQILDERTLCRWFISVNEPVNLTFNAYISGYFPPYQHLRFGKTKILKEKVKQMHRIVYDELKKHAPSTHQAAGKETKIGMTHHVPHSDIKIYEKLGGWDFIEEMQDGQTSDFLGLQYYFRLKLSLLLSGFKGKDERYISGNELCPQIYPPGAYDVLKEADRRWPGKELVLSEWGFTNKVDAEGNESDKERPDWILSTIGHVTRAIREGVNVKGALYWPLSGNFEWRLGGQLHGRNALIDHHGNPLSWDNKDPQIINSAEALACANDHLLHPTPEKAAQLANMRAKTWQELNKLPVSP